MNVASKELCQDLEKVSHWEDTESAWLWIEAHNEYEVDNGDPLAFGHPPIPAYDLGYLLRKLPASVESKEYAGKFAQLWTRKDDGPNDDIESPITYFAWYLVVGIQDGVSDFGENADTPEDAAAKLAIELFNQGVLQHV